jgi:cell shape-determining protein MreC
MINLAEERGNLRQYRRRIKELEVEYIKLVKLLGMSTENTYHRIVTELLEQIHYCLLIDD